MGLYSSPPSLWALQYNKPTILVCWWATTLCTVIIALRVCGRFVRTERLFREDKMAALALVPMLLRMGCVHCILLWGTNNADYSGVVLSAEDLRRIEIASGLVLLARVLYPLTLWILKDSMLEFFRRLTGVTWSRTYEEVLFAIRCVLGATFVAVVVSTLVECRPFSHYWQVLPDPGPQCRQGYVQLITLAACDVLTDLILVLFPVPIILRTQMSLKRKVQLVLLFSLSLGVAAVTIYRVPNTISRQGRQQYRSLLASIELLFATGAANSLIIGSFVRDRGLKKNKRIDFATLRSQPDFREPTPRRPALENHWGSDEDLVRELGLGCRLDLRHHHPNSSSADSALSQPFRPAQPVQPRAKPWRAPCPTAENPHRIRRTQVPSPVDSNEDHISNVLQPSDSTPDSASPHPVLQDAGNLLSVGDDIGQQAASRTTPVEPRAPVLPLAATVSSPPSVWCPSPAPASPPSSPPMSPTSPQRGMSLRMSNLSGLLQPSQSPVASPASRSGSPSLLLALPSSRPGAIPDTEILDPGGLLRSE